MEFPNLLLLSNPPSSPLELGEYVGQLAIPEHDGSSQSTNPSPSSSMPLVQFSIGTGAVGHRAPSLLELDGTYAKRLEVITPLVLISCTAKMTYIVPV